jgi:hypothetical protein
MYEFTVVGLMKVSGYCLCTTVTSKSLSALLESGDHGTYRDEHPWLAASQLLKSELDAGRRMALLFAVEDSAAAGASLSHWALIDDIEVMALHKGAWSTRVRFAALREVNPIWRELDSIMLKPGDDQLQREQLEPIRLHRQPLDQRHVHPYAICETPPFMLAD